jgi:hypothetical protein
MAANQSETRSPPSYQGRSRFVPIIMFVLKTAIADTYVFFDFSTFLYMSYYFLRSFPYSIFQSSEVRFRI